MKEQYLAKNGSTLTDEDLAKLDPTAPVSLFFFSLVQSFESPLGVARSNLGKRGGERGGTRLDVENPFRGYDVLL